MGKIALFSILTIILIPQMLYSQSDHYFTLSNTKTRPLALGGAFTSIEDDLAAVHYNPAAYLLYKNEESKSLNIFINPISPIIGVFQTGSLYNGKGSLFDDVLFTTSLLIKSISISIKTFELGILLGEESFNLKNTDIFGVSGYRQNHSHSIVGRLKLAEKVSLGGSASLFYSDSNNPSKERFSDFGISYGILLKPAKGLNVGVAYINLPDSLKDYRLPLEQIVDESINIGVSYQLFKGNLFSVDFRNLGEQDKKFIRNFHFGLEQAVLSHVAVRIGYYQKDKSEHVFSLGIGLLNGNQIFRGKYESAMRNFYLNYAFVFEKSPKIDKRWHLFSCIIRI